MREITLNIPTKELIQFLRAEILFSDLTRDYADGNGSYWEMEFSLSEPYQVTYDDIVTAIHNAKQNAFTIEQFIYGWFEPFYNNIADLVGLPALIGHPELETMDEVWDIGSTTTFFPKNESQLIFAILEDMDGYANDVNACCDEDGILPTLLDDYLERIKNLEHNRTHPTEEWIFTEREAKLFVYDNHHDGQLQNLGTAKRAVYKRYLEALCDKNDLKAIEIRGYACYGTGNALYECDWYTARDCMLKLVELGDDAKKAKAANTLGYIYYYGRCNHMVPEYEQAYRYFSYAGYYGYFESNYKVGDMLAGGLGIMKNERAAYLQYLKVYNECYELFQSGSRNHTLSDAALRMGRAYYEGIGVEKSFMKSYYYYLQAKTAIDIRMKQTDFYGITKVKENIENGLKQTRETLTSLGEDLERNDFFINIQAYLKVLANENHKLKLVIEESETEYRLHFSRKMIGKYDDAKKVMVTIPQCSFCEVTDHLTFIAPKDIDLHLRNDKLENDKQEMTIDRIEEKGEYIHFYHDGKSICKFRDVPMKLHQVRGK